MPLINYKPEVYGQTAPLDLEFVTLNPTWQEKSISDWEKVMAHPIYSQTVEEMIEDGALMVQEVQEEHVGLDSYSKSSALKIIKDTFDEELLKRWQNESDVAAYQTAIAKQLDKFKPKGDEPEETATAKSRAKSSRAKAVASKE